MSRMGWAGGREHGKIYGCQIWMFRNVKSWLEIANRKSKENHFWNQDITTVPPTTPVPQPAFQDYIIFAHIKNYITSPDLPWESTFQRKFVPCRCSVFASTKTINFIWWPLMLLTCLAYIQTSFSSNFKMWRNFAFCWRGLVYLKILRKLPVRIILNSEMLSNISSSFFVPADFNNE